MNDSNQWDSLECGCLSQGAVFRSTEDRNTFWNNVETLKCGLLDDVIFYVDDGASPKLAQGLECWVNYSETAR